LSIEEFEDTLKSKLLAEARKLGIDTFHLNLPSWNIILSSKDFAELKLYLISMAGFSKIKNGIQIKDLVKVEKLVDSYYVRLSVRVVNHTGILTIRYMYEH